MKRQKYEESLQTLVIKMPVRLCKEIDEAVSVMGYANRSELVRDAVRKLLERQRGEDGD